MKIYKVYYEHIWGGAPIFEGAYKTREAAEKARNQTEDAMFDAWIVEKEEPKANEQKIPGNKSRVVKVTLMIEVANIKGGDQITDESIKKLFEKEIKHSVSEETYRQLNVKSVEIDAEVG